MVFPAHIVSKTAKDTVTVAMECVLELSNGTIFSYLE